MKINVESIGLIESKYFNKEDCPPNGWASDYVSTIRLKGEYVEGSSGLKSGMIIHVIWWFDKAERNILKQPPKPEAEELGVFAMRSPQRPNPIALSLCRIEKIRNNLIYVKGLEAINDSAVLDIKKAVNYEKYIL